MAQPVSSEIPVEAARRVDCPSGELPRTVSRLSEACGVSHAAGRPADDRPTGASATRFCPQPLAPPQGVRSRRCGPVAMPHAYRPSVEPSRLRRTETRRYSWLKPNPSSLHVILVDVRDRPSQMLRQAVCRSLASLRFQSHSTALANGSFGTSVEQQDVSDETRSINGIRVLPCRPKRRYPGVSWPWGHAQAPTLARPPATGSRSTPPLAGPSTVISLSYPMSTSGSAIATRGRRLDRHLTRNCRQTDGLLQAVYISGMRSSLRRRRS
jgi:hypothetical protein